MIILDPTEANSSTKIPIDVITRATLCEGLEGLTGADMLISPLDNPKLTTVSSKLGQLSLQKHLEAGAVLVQRKSGSDIINFMKDHDQILAKMLKFTNQPWLLTTGLYTIGKDDKLFVNGSRVGGSEGWSYWSYWGSLRSWQLRGGYVDNISKDSMMLDWYTRTKTKISSHEESVYAMPRKPSQQIIIEDGSDAEAYERAACITALATIDNVGISKAVGIANYCGNLANAIAFLSDPQNMNYRDGIGYPKGVGSKIFSNASRWLGLKHSGVGRDQFYERMIIDTVNIGEDNND